MADYDIIVVGGGPGGYTAALHGAKAGLRVALFEQDLLGGTCLNRGCIPTKALLHAAAHYHQSVNGAACGVHCAPSYDMGEMHQYAQGVMTQLRSGVAGLLQRAKVEVISARAQLQNAYTVCAAGQQYTAQHIILAVGSLPLMPPIDGIDGARVHSSDYFLENPVDVKSLLIVGGGVIGVEMAQIYCRLGAQVTLLEGMPRLLPSLDKEVGQSVAAALKKQGVQVITNAQVSAFDSQEAQVHCHFTPKQGAAQCCTAERALVCVGRRANTAGLFADGFEIPTERGLLAVNAQGQTAVPNIYAIGDVVLGGVQLAHAAEAQGANVICSILGKSMEKDLSLIPACVFTDPEIATVGLSAEQAKAAGIVVITAKKLTSANGRSLVEGAERGFVKLVAEAETNRLVGAVLCCTHAGEMIGGLTAAIAAGLTLAQLEATIFPHPTVSETIVG